MLAGAVPWPAAARFGLRKARRKILHEGPPEPGTLIQYFQAMTPPLLQRPVEKGTISGKGVLNNRISEHIFTLLGTIGVPTHFIRRLNMREQLIRQVEIVPIEVVVRNVAAGRLHQAAGDRGRHAAAPHDHRILLQGRRARRPDGRRRAYRLLRLGQPGGDARHGRHGDPRERLHERGCSPASASAWSTSSSEFGRIWDNDYSRIILADEISPDGCRLRDMATGEKLDKDRFRRDLGGEVEAYQEIARRLGLLPEGAETAVLDMETHRKTRGSDRPCAGWASPRARARFFRRWRLASRSRPAP